MNLPAPIGLCLILISLCGVSAQAALRSRALPAVPDRIEAGLVERAAQSGAERLHVVLRAPRAGRAEAERAGVRLLHSLDGDLWLASVPASRLTVASLPPGVDGIWDLRPEDRRSDRFAADLARENRGRIIDVRLKLFADADFESVLITVRRAGTVLRRSTKLRFLDVRLPAGSVGGLLRTDGLRWMSRAPADPVPTNNGLRVDAEVDVVQVSGVDGSGVLVGMWDTGIADATHPDLTGRVVAGETGLPVKLHSTHVAGIVLGDGTNSLAQGGGGLQWRGVATGASLVGYDAPDAVTEVDSAITMHDIDLSTNSWVYPVGDGNCDDYGDYAIDAPEFDQIVAGIYGKAIPVVFSAGNERDDGDCSIVANGGYWTIPPPATAKNVITVGAHFSDVLHMTPFSSWGPTDDGRMKPDMSAPGCQQGDDFGIKSTSLSGQYSSLCGTSMSAPAVSGSIGMLIQAWRGIYVGDPRPATAKALLGGFAKDRANPGPDYRFGLGAIHAEASVQALQTASTIEDEVPDLGFDDWSFRVPAGTDTLVVTLTWDDVAGVELADTALVNDLDLILIDPALGVHFPFVLDPANPSVDATTGVNRLDVVEQVRVLAPAAGDWTARVMGLDVPQGPQEYSLVGFDGRPPADPALSNATAVDDTTVECSWIRAGDADRAGTLVVRSTSPVLWTPVDGTTYLAGSEPSPGVFVVVADDTDHSAVPFPDAPLDPGTVYHYAFFSHDEIPNYSIGVADSAETSTEAVGVPVVAASVPTVRFERAGRHPARDGAEFRLDLPTTSMVLLEVLDVSGRRVATLVNGERAAGSHAIAWNGRRASGETVTAGIYFVRLRTEAGTETRKVVLLR